MATLVKPHFSALFLANREVGVGQVRGSQLGGKGASKYLYTLKNYWRPPQKQLLFLWDKRGISLTNNLKTNILKTTIYCWKKLNIISKIYNVQGYEGLHIVKMSILPKLIYTFKAIPIKTKQANVQKLSN